MGDTEKQEKAYKFLRDKFESQEEFTKDDFIEATGWDGKTLSTYWSKQYKTLLVDAGAKHFRVAEVFRRFPSWGHFQSHVTQNRYIAADYNTLVFRNVILFEFFMPLTNEGHLRTSLDALFYRDTVLSRLKTVSPAKLQEHFPKEEGESEDAWLSRACDFVSNVFGGYSIGHVSGRYRADELKTIGEIYANAGQFPKRYLVDETTAIVRFIFPCGKPNESKFLSTEHYFEDLETEIEDASEMASKIRWFFYILFVQSIVQIVNGEDEIWMLESGMRSRLHIWRVQR